MKPPYLIGVIIILAIPLLALIFYKGSNNSSPNSNTMPSSSTGLSSSSPQPTPSAPADAVSATKATVKTSKGDINLILFPNEAPLAVANFVTLGKRGYYDGVIFHRVIAGFMNQAGDPTGTGSGGESIYGKYFKTELNSRPFLKGVLGAARTSQMDTNGSQFFIMAADTHSLDNQYTAFGQVADASSQKVVDDINAVSTDGSDKPLQDVKITSFAYSE